MSSRTHESLGLDEHDLALVNALQIYPRAPWTLLGPILELDPATLTRRWARLTDGGYAWITTAATQAYIDQACTAMVEIKCVPGQALQAATTLAQDPQTVTIDRLAGDQDLLLTVFTADLPAMERYISNRLGRLPGARDIASHIMIRHFSGSGSWRLDALDRDQTARIERAVQHPSPQPGELETRDREMLQLLHTDGRRSYVELAHHLGVSPMTAQRRLARLEAIGYLAWRCDFARPLVGWPVTAIYRAAAPTGHTTDTARTLVQFPETRFCVTLAGQDNIVLAAYLHSIADADRFEAEVSARLPQLTIRDRAIVYHTVKAYSRLLDPQGRSIGTIPPNLLLPDPSTANS
ncbi:Lrp/AsnC family transcriptional regulator [Nocardia sp. NPDC051570]|uniref:Lrp/AsnC family transcriptional regulator n=1 Tax=Nocardia sp. NPDC051570 TaxID=3364324 RepID=UPI0037AAE6C6